MAGPRMADRRILIVALILGAVAAGLAVAFLVSADQEPAPEPLADARSVIVATKPIEAGTKITEDMLEVRELPASAVIEGASSDLELVVGETARYPIAQGEQVNAVRLVAPVEVQALSFQIPEGMRGVTIPVSVNESPAALLAPGDFVDVLVAADAENLVTPATVLTGPSLSVEASTLAGDRKAAATLLQNIQVLTVQRAYVANGVPYDPSVRGVPPEDDGVSYVTLALSPEQAQLLWLASQDGELTLTLRAFGDDHVSPVGTSTRLLGAQQ
ncbi:MAG: Flp pilus assembly protein CpaB [Dehalococcoidia bacterium]